MRNRRARARAWLSYASHRNPAEEAARTHEQENENEQQRRRQLQGRADETDVAAEQRDRDAEQDSADDRSDGTVEPPEHGGRERVQQDRLHHVRVEEDDR